MKTALSVSLFIFGAFSILFSFVGISMLFDPNETQKGIDVFLIIFFLGLGVSLIILGVIMLKSALAKNKVNRLNIETNLINNNKPTKKVDETENESMSTKSNNPYEMKF